MTNSSVSSVCFVSRALAVRSIFLPCGVVDFICAEEQHLPPLPNIACGDPRGYMPLDQVIPDDTQIYLSLSLNELGVWMRRKFLLLNNEKTEM